MAAFIWSVVGLFLLIRGFGFTLVNDHLWYGLVGMAIGTVKAIFILDRTAKKNIKRIKEFDDNTCLGSVYSWKTWLLVAAMILLGRFLRTSAMPREVVGLIYTAVGWGLMLASRLMWLEWKRTT